MTAIRRRDRGLEWWVDFRFRGKRVRRPSPAQTKRGTEQYERTLRNDLVADAEAGRDPFAGPPPLFRDFADRWMREYVAVRNRPAVVREKESALRIHLLPTFGLFRLNEITPAHIDAFVASKTGAGLKPKTINNQLTILRCALSTAQEWRLIRAVPRVRWVRVPEQPYKCLTRPELERLISAATPGYWRALVTFIADTGVRFGEAAALRWADVVLDSTLPEAHIVRASSRGIIGPTKTGRVRVVPLTARVRDELNAMHRGSDLVFARKNGRVPRSENTCPVLHRFCDRGGVQHVGWHALRHTYATLLCQRGVPIRNVQMLLGHTTIVTTSRYTHASPNELHWWVSHALEGISAESGHQVATKPPAAAP